jgi:hypothetical protein
VRNLIFHIIRYIYTGLGIPFLAVAFIGLGIMYAGIAFENWLERFYAE